MAALLIDKGFICKERSRRDRMVYHLVLTEPGRELSVKFRRAYSKHIRSTLGSLSDDEQVEYHEYLSALNRLMRKRKKNGALIRSCFYLNIIS